MARRRSKKSDEEEKKEIDHYDHKNKQRKNIPPAGLVDIKNDPEEKLKEYHNDPNLDPELMWVGKKERTSFKVPTVSLHVHENIDPLTIIEAVRKKNKGPAQRSIFDFERNEPIYNAIEFYKHSHNWSNRLIAGDSLLVMNSLLEKEGMAGKIQTIYIDPPYGIKYGSNFQPFVNKRDVKDGKDEDLTQEPEMLKAFRDTWELGIHSYLTYLRDRILLSKELLHETGSIFIQISDENLHHVKEILDELMGPNNFCALIAFAKTSAFTSELLSTSYDFLLWYAKDKNKVKYNTLWQLKKERTEGGTYNNIEFKDGSYRRLTIQEIRGETQLPQGHRFRADTIVSAGAPSTGSKPVIFNGKEYYPSPNSHWKTTLDGMYNLIKKNRVVPVGKILAYKRYDDDFPYMPYTNVWDDTIIGTFTEKLYVVQTSTRVIERCILMTTDPGDIVFDPTCGSGTTAYVAEQWGRRWITCDTSRVAITLAKQRLMTALFDYYKLAYPEQGVSNGFLYKTVPHITLKSIANNEPPAQETLYDQPFIDNTKVRVTGPFTVEAVPSPVVHPIDEEPVEPKTANVSAGREGETLRQAEWRAELLRTGVRGKAGQVLEFTRVEPLPGTYWLQADAETKEEKPRRAVISYGPEFAPMEQRQVELAILEARVQVPRPDIVIFAAFQFEPEAAKNIDITNWPGVTLLKVQMNADLFTDDLKKKRSSNESFWLVGQPDITVTKITDGPSKGLYTVHVNGFDYYNVKEGGVISGGEKNIAVWMLDPDYDGRSLFPRQVFFPMAGEKDGWARLAKSLQVELDEERIEAYRGTESLPFVKGPHEQIAVKIVDDRGIESLRIMKLE